METHELSFGNVIILQKDLAEIIINDGIEVSLKQVIEADEFLVAHLKSPFSLLFNKKYHYSFEFNAQEKLGVVKGLNAVAIVCYSQVNSTLTKALSNVINNTEEWNMQDFTNRDDALDWLASEQEKANKKSI